MLSRLSTKHVFALSRRYAASSVSEFDLIVIGGGSGGLSCSKAASEYGASVALVNGVTPSPHGTTWGIGGTCANVGCIPKKLMHHAGIVGKEVDHAETYGWTNVEKGKHSWEALVKVVNDRIKANSWIYRVQLHKKGVKLYTAIASFIDNHTVKIVSTDNKRTELTLRAPNIVLATGLRPRYPEIPGADNGITSDDLFWSVKSPGKTLVVGASYVALETAGMLADLGLPVDLLIRSRPLKPFDQDCVKCVVEGLKHHGANVIYGREVGEVALDGDKRKVTFKDVSTGQNVANDVYDTVIWAMGRDPQHGTLNLAAAGIDVDSSSDRIIVGDDDRTSARNIYAIGDIALGRPELTPAAIRAGQLLAGRLFNGSKELMDYFNIPTTVFTPLELGTVGHTEEQAAYLFGAENIEVSFTSVQVYRVYHSHFTPFEYVVPQDDDSAHCYAKVMV
ncbi:hypothetical protein Y032_0275g1072 [Ancylostoma ceylanicum]|uniref:FAD/NAD(P)-binding domain-containing protein n=1 Tax=Ancylostoma ceylanicum TaxID=53326 RepID=A0A016S8U1_9BILA|nr:hypothetical protein Y032_0275g1072 [Ancylostoma ceylanicum]